MSRSVFIEGERQLRNGDFGDLAAKKRGRDRKRERQ